MDTSITLLLCLLTAGLVILLARENKLRRTLQQLCSRLLYRLAASRGSSRPQSPLNHQETDPS